MPGAGLSSCDETEDGVQYPRDGERGWPFLYYRADWQRWCAQIPTAKEWRTRNRAAFRDNGGYCTPILDEAMA
jgi:hypothetical protein